MTIEQVEKVAERAYKATKNDSLRESYDSILMLLNELRFDTEEINWRLWNDIPHYTFFESASFAGHESEIDNYLEIRDGLDTYENALRELVYYSNPSEINQLLNDGWDPRI